jgi:YHS domain-containing protein
MHSRSAHATMRAPAVAALALLALVLAGCGAEDATEAPDVTTTEPAADQTASSPDDHHHHDHDHDHAHDHAHDHDHEHEHDHDHGDDHDHHHHASGEGPAPPTTGDPYPLAVCPVSGFELGSMGEPIVHEHNGRQVRFCCGDCVEPFEEDPDAHLAEADERIIEDQLPHYPLDTCVVSGESLGSMGDPVDMVVGNRLVRLCCAMCAPDVEGDPAGILATLDAAATEAQLADYPLDRCVVSAEPLDEWGDPVDKVFAHRLVRFCCDTCAEDFHAAPARYLALRDAGELPNEPVTHDHNGHDHNHDHDHDHDH